MVKQSLSREAALSEHPGVARRLVRTAAEEVVAAAAAAPHPAVLGDLEVDLLTSDMAQQAAWVRGVERTGDRTVTLATADPLSAYRSFVALIAITRNLSVA